MNSTFLSKKRGSLAISIAILRAARNGIKKSHLISSLSLSFQQFKKYVEFLKANGFIIEYDTSYKTTDKGLALIEEFESSSLIRSVLVA